MSVERRGEGDGPALLPLLLVLVSVLPDPRALVPSLTYYFRDFTLTYLPLRAFFAREAALGRWPFWNRYLHEGCPFLPMFYPTELAQWLWSGPAAVSWLLTIHIPVAALSCYALARHLGCSRWGAFASGSIYALGGLCLSCVNLHWFLQALALAPAVVLATRRAACRGGRAIPVAGFVLALAVSTLAVEFVAQAWILGAVLGLAAAPRRLALLRLALVGALGAGLAALPITLMLGIVAESLRGAGLPASLTLQNSLHPVLFLQALVPDLAGSLTEPLQAWWGGRLYAGGSPYFLSLYVGPVALALAVAGVRAFPSPTRPVLMACGAAGCLYALGSHTGLAEVLHPLLPWFRFPVKALLTPHLCVALWAGAGLDRLGKGAAWGLLTSASAATAGLVTLVGSAAVLGAGPLATWLDVSPRAARLMAGTLGREAAVGAAVSATVIALAISVRLGRLGPLRATPALLLLLVFDLWRGGVGVNPQTSPAFFDPAPGLMPLLADLDGGRVFSHGVNASPAVRDLVSRHGPGVDRSSFLLARRVLDPFANLLDGVEVAEGNDRLSFVANPPAVAPSEYAPEAVSRILPRLRAAAVSRLVTLDPLEDPGLRLRGEVDAGPPGVSIRVYDVLRPWPRAYVACRAVAAANAVAAYGDVFREGFDPGRDVVLERPVASEPCESGSVRRRLVFGDTETYDVESVGPGYLVMRDTFSPSWAATLDGHETPLLRANGRHRAVALPGGRHAVKLEYRPPGFASGVVATLIALALATIVTARPVLSAAPAGRG